MSDPGPLTIQLLVCDDQGLVRAGLVQLLQSDRRFRVAAQASGRVELLDLLHGAADIDVLLLDPRLGAPWLDSGIELIETLHAQWRSMPVVVVSAVDDAEIVGRALQAGARGYVTKDSNFDVLQDAILQVHLGRRYLAPNLLEPIVLGRAGLGRQRWDSTLTPRERDVMARICAGERLTQIAADWGVSIKTVSTHKVRLMEKLNVATSADLIKLAVRQGTLKA
jgi:DNA-binding NarL/FixJ family response regulator